MIDPERRAGHGPTDEGLRARFTELRAERESEAASFAETVRVGRSAERIRAAERVRTRRRAGWALALAAPAVIAALLVQLGEWAEERRALEAAQAAAALAEWRPPSDALLGGAYVVWMQGMPSLQASAVEFDSRATGGSQ